MLRDEHREKEALSGRFVAFCRPIELPSAIEFRSVHYLMITDGIDLQIAMHFQGVPSRHAPGNWRKAQIQAAHAKA